MSNNFHAGQEKIKNFLAEDILGGTLARTAAKEAAKDAAKTAAKPIARAAARTAAETTAKAGAEVVAGPVAGALSSTPTAPRAATTTEIPPELKPILRPTSRPEDKPEIRPESPTETPAASTTDDTGFVNTIGIPLLGQLLGLKLGFNPFPQGIPQPQSKSKSDTKTKTATTTKTGEDLSGPSLLAVPRGSSTPQYAYSSTKFAQETAPVFQTEIQPEGKKNKVAEDLTLGELLRKKTLLNLLSEEDIKSLEPSISGPRSPQAARMQERSLSTMSTPDTRKNRANAIQRMKDAIAAMNVETPNTPKPTINPKYAGLPISAKSKKIPATKKILEKPS